MDPMHLPSLMDLEIPRLLMDPRTLLSLMALSHLLPHMDLGTPRLLVVLVVLDHLLSHLELDIPRLLILLRLLQRLLMPENLATTTMRLMTKITRDHLVTAMAASLTKTRTTMKRSPGLTPSLLTPLSPLLLRSQPTLPSQLLTLPRDTELRLESKRLIDSLFVQCAVKNFR